MMFRAGYTEINNNIIDSLTVYKTDDICVSPNNWVSVQQIKLGSKIYTEEQSELTVCDIQSQGDFVTFYFG